MLVDKMDRFKFPLLLTLAGVLIFLLYLSLSQNNKAEPTDELSGFMKCFELMKCKGSNCPPLPKICSRAIRKATAPKAKPKPKPTPEKDQKALNKLFSDIMKKKEKKNSNKVKPLNEEELRRAREQSQRKPVRNIEQAKRRHQSETETVSFNLRQVDMLGIEKGFNHTLNNVFLALTLIAFGMSISGLSSKLIIQIFALLCLSTIIAALFINDTIIKYYNYMGPYLFMLGGVSLLLYEEQKSYTLPALGIVIGVFLGFTVATDSPIEGNKWPFIVGTLFAAGFLMLVFSIAVQLFNKSWFSTIMNIMGGGLIAFAVVIFALEARKDGLEFSQNTVPERVADGRQTHLPATLPRNPDTPSVRYICKCIHSTSTPA